MTYFFADLDGTVIRSARTKRAGDITVEYKDGAAISCISEKSAALLPKLNIIPVTSRSIEQYRRITFPLDFSPKYAITDNGGNLLIDGEVQPDWAEKSAEITRSCAEELKRCYKLLECDPDRSFEIRMVDNLFLFTKSGCPEKTEKRLGGLSNCDFYRTGEKIYVIPRRINKGEGAMRLLGRIGNNDKIICAGDSEMDIPLLNIADIAVFPDSLSADRINCPVKRTSRLESFCEFAVETASEIMGIC